MTAKFAFVYSVPRRVFERLSCRCHLLSSYIRRWRSGVFTQYGCVKMLVHAEDNERQVTVTARTPNTGQNLFCLFHVLWRCVNEMENVLVTIPGVLLDRYITMKKSMQSRVGHQRKTYCMTASGPQYDVDNVSRMKKALELPASPGIETGRSVL